MCARERADEIHPQQWSALSLHSELATVRDQGEAFHLLYVLNSKAGKQLLVPYTPMQGLGDPSLPRAPRASLSLAIWKEFHPAVLKEGLKADSKIISSSACPVWSLTTSTSTAIPYLLES